MSSCGSITDVILLVYLCAAFNNYFFILMEDQLHFYTASRFPVYSQNKNELSYLVEINDYQTMETLFSKAFSWHIASWASIKIDFVSTFCAKHVVIFNKSHRKLLMSYYCFSVVKHSCGIYLQGTVSIAVQI